MPTVTVTKTGTGKTHSTAYSVRRFIYFWPMGTLTGRKVKKATIKIAMRASTTITTGYTLVLMNGFASSWITTDSSVGKWKYRNANSYYQYEGKSSSYYTRDNYLTFDSTPLVTQAVTLNVTGGAGNKVQTVTVDIPTANQDISLWSGKNIYLAWYSTNGSYSNPPELIWGTEVTGSITLTIQQSSTINYWNGSSWISCIPYYWDGSSWVECGARYYNGSAWVECDSG